MYLPKSKYKVTSECSGKFILAETGENYAGPVLTDYRGISYAGSDPSNLKGKLETLTGGDIFEETKVNMLGRRIPTKQEYQEGQMVRYFLQDLSTMKVIEILPSRYESMQVEGLPENSVIASCTWYLVGRLDNYRVSGHWIEGIRSKNQKAIDQMEEKLPGISSSKVLHNPEEFVRESA